MQRTRDRRQLDRLNKRANGPALLFDLDGTLVDSVYQHVLAWREALEQAGIELAVWRIHRRIGMSGGLLGFCVNPLKLGRFLGGNSASRFPQEIVRQQTAAHSDTAMNTPHSQFDTRLFQGFAPSQNMLVNAVHQGTVQIE